MSDRNIAPAWFGNGLADWRTLVERCNIYPGRALGRALVAGTLAAFSIGSALDLPDEPPGVERTTDVAIAIVSAIVLLVVLRRFGQGRGILWGFWLSFISWLWFQGVLLAAYVAWVAAGLNGAPTVWGEVCIGAAISAVVVVPCTLWLGRVDPDF